MFKPQKALSVKESRALSGKDVKTLRKKVETQFNLEGESFFSLPFLIDHFSANRPSFFRPRPHSLSALSLSTTSATPESALNALLPPKAEVTLLKLYNRSSAWAVAGTPLFFDLDGRGSGPLLPTVYFLWAAVRAASAASASASGSSSPPSPSPSLLPEVFTFSEVSSKVLGGADLFLQGFLPERGGPPPGLNAGDLAVVRIEGNPFPFALGTMEVSSADAVAGGMKGKGLRLLHHAFDALWSLGDKSTPGAEFTAARVFPMATATATAPASASPAASASGAVAPAATVPGEKEEGEEDQEKEKEEDGAVERASAGIAALGLSPSSPPPSAAAAAAGAAPSSSPHGAPSFFPSDLDLSSTAGQDAIAEYCLVSACASVDASSLPMLTSDFQKEMARANKLAGVPALDLKKSSFKQLSKLLKKYERLGLLGTKVLRKQDMVASVDAGHALVVEFLAKGGGGGGGSGGSGSGGGSGGGNGGGENPAAMGGEAGAKPSSSSSSSSAAAVPPLSIEPAYRVSPSLRPVFAAPGAPPAPADDFYSEAEVKKALSAYLVAEKLLVPSEGTTPTSASASVDRLLLAALFNKGSDRELAEGQGKTLPVSELEERLLSRLTKFTRVRRGVAAAAAAAAAGSSSPSASPLFEERVFRGPLKKISIAVEDRQGGRKHVTRVSGVERYALSPDVLASTLQKKFKTSASVSRVSADEEEVSLQGDAARQLVLFLGIEYGIGAAHIDVKTKGGR